MATEQITEDLEIVLESGRLLGLDDDDDVMFSDAFLAFMLAFGGLTGASSASAAPAGTTITVASSAELLAALKEATGGETILLQTGQYELSLSGVSPLEAVTIRSADGAGGAVFSSIVVRSSANLIFDDITVRRPLAEGEPLWTKAVDVRNSANIAFRNSEFFGSADGNYGNDGDGFFAKAVTGLLLEGNEFHDLFRGAVFNSSSDIVVRDNVVHHLRKDGMDFVGVSNVVIEQNHFSSFFPMGNDHGDFIQFWTANIGGSQNVIIRNNVMLQGEGLPEQGTFEVHGILIGNHSPEYNHYNFTIEGNVYYGRSHHGITLEDVSGATVSHNTVVSLPDATMASGINLDGTDNVRVDSNVAMQFRQSDDQGSVLNNNVTAQYGDPFLATHVNQLFLDAFAGTAATAADFGPRPGGLLDGNPPIGAIVAPALDDVILLDSDFGTARSLSVSMQAANLSLETQASESYAWNFGDGQTATGRDVAHTYAKGGTYTITLTVGDGETARMVTKTVVLEHPLLLDQRFENTLSDLSEQMITAEWIGTARYGEGAEGRAAEFVADGSYISVTPPPSLGGTPELTLQFDVKADGTTSGTERLVWYQNHYGVDLKDSILTAWLYNQDGVRTQLAVDAGRLADGNWHQVTVSYSVELGQLVVYLDDDEMARSSGLTGRVASVEMSKFYVGGTPWGNLFDGLIDNLTVTHAYAESGAPIGSGSGGTASGESYLQDFDGSAVQLYGNASLADGPWGQAAQFGGGTAYANLGQPAAFFDAVELSVSMDFKLDAAVQATRVPLLYATKQLAIELKGDDLLFRLWKEDGTQLQVWAEDLSFQDQAWHNIGFTFDAGTGRFQGYYDGAAVVDIQVQAVLGSAASWDVFLGGTPWGQAFNGKIDNLAVYNDIIAPTASPVPVAVVPLPDYLQDFDGGPVGLQGAASLVDGPWGQAAQFDGGKAYADLGQPAGILDTGGLSLFTSFKLDTAQQAASVPLLYNDRQFAIELRDDDVLFRLWTNNGKGGKEVKVWARDLDFQDQQWHSVGFTLDEGTKSFKGYYDGALIVDTTLRANITGPSQWDVYLGGTPWGEALQGKIDNLAVYDQVVDPATASDLTLALSSDGVHLDWSQA